MRTFTATWFAAMHQDPPQDLIKKLYIEWLCGASLRKLSHLIGGRYSYSALHTAFKRQFGQLATNPVAMSLARSILEDYRERSLLPEDELIALALRMAETPETMKHRSEHSLQMLGSYQVVHDPRLMDSLASSEDSPLDLLEEPPEEPLDFLRLRLATLVFSATVALLRAALASLALPNEVDLAS